MELRGTQLVAKPAASTTIGIPLRNRARPSPEIQVAIDICGVIGVKMVSCDAASYSSQIHAGSFCFS